MEVHRVKAVRFSVPSKEEEDYEEIGEPSSVISEAERGYVESASRSGSQMHLTEKRSGREMTDKQKTPNSFLCGLCCSKSSAVSVWNCDGEILPVTEVFCRWVRSHCANHNNLANFNPIEFFLLGFTASCYTCMLGASRTRRCTAAVWKTRQHPT